MQQCSLRWKVGTAPYHTVLMAVRSKRVDFCLRACVHLRSCVCPMPVRGLSAATLPTRHWGRAHLEKCATTAKRMEWSDDVLRGNFHRTYRTRKVATSLLFRFTYLPLLLCACCHYLCAISHSAVPACARKLIHAQAIRIDRVADNKETTATAMERIDVTEAIAGNT